MKGGELDTSVAELKGASRLLERAFRARLGSLHLLPFAYASVLRSASHAGTGKATPFSFAAGASFPAPASDRDPQPLALPGNPPSACSLKAFETFLNCGSERRVTGTQIDWAYYRFGHQGAARGRRHSSNLTYFNAAGSNPCSGLKSRLHWPGM